MHGIGWADERPSVAPGIARGRGCSCSTSPRGCYGTAQDAVLNAAVTKHPNPIPGMLNKVLENGLLAKCDSDLLYPSYPVH